MLFSFFFLSGCSGNETQTEAEASVAAGEDQSETETSGSDSLPVAPTVSDSTVTAQQSSTTAETNVVKSVLVFSETPNQYGADGKRNPWIQEGIEAGRAFFEQIQPPDGYEVEFVFADQSEPYFTAEKLSSFDALVFLSTSADVLNNQEQLVFEEYIKSGKGFLGIHYAIAGLTEPGWKFYEDMFGTTWSAVAGANPDYGLTWQDFDKTIAAASLQMNDATHPISKGIDSQFSHTDEWYRFAGEPVDADVLLSLDASSLADKPYFQLNSPTHPISWAKEDYFTSRFFYTQLGDNEASYSNEIFRKHLSNSLFWVLRFE